VESVQKRELFRKICKKFHVLPTASADLLDTILVLFDSTTRISPIKMKFLIANS
jgi:hypothetical protein